MGTSLKDFWMLLTDKIIFLYHAFLNHIPEAFARQLRPASNYWIHTMFSLQTGKVCVNLLMNFTAKR